MALAAAVWARCTGVNPASVYRRWRTREGLLADVAMSRLERDLPLPDTGSLRGDLTAWAVSAAAGLARPEGRLFLLALITSIPSTPAGPGRTRPASPAADAGPPAGHRPGRNSGREPPDPGTIADAVLGPLYRRALWGTLPADPAYASSLVDRLLSPACHNDANI